MARIGAQLVFVWQFSQGIVRGPCGLRLGCRWATAGMTRASAKKTNASERANWTLREMLPPKRLKLFCFCPFPKREKRDRTTIKVPVRIFLLSQRTELGPVR